MRLLFTDLHLKEDRKEDQKNIIDQIIELAIMSHVNSVDVLGDVFDNRNRISAHLYNLVSYLNKTLNEHGIIIRYLSGNHDKPHDQSSISFLTPLGNDSSRLVFDTEEDVKIIDNILFIPFLPEERFQKVLEKSSSKHVEYIYIHQGVNGVRDNKKHKHESSIKINSFSDLYPNLRKIFSGHFHNRVSYKKGLLNYLGNPMQMDHADDMTKGVWLFDNEKHTKHFIQLNYPLFITHELKSNVDGFDKAISIISDKENENNFIRLIFKGTKDKLVQIPRKDLEKLNKTRKIVIDEDIFHDGK